MKKAKRREVKHTISKPTEFDKDYERRLRAEFEFRHLTRKLRKVQEWMPRLIMEHPNTKPEEVIKELRGQREKVWENLAELRKNKIGELHRISIPQPPEYIDRTRDPYEILGKVKKYHDFLKGMRAQAGILAEFVPRREMGEVVVGGVEELPVEEEEPIEGIAVADELRELGTFEMYPVDAYPEPFFTHEYLFNPSGINYDTRIGNPHDDPATLKTSAASKFTFPRAPFDALVWWWINATMIMPYTLDAAEAHFKVDWIFCNWPDASVPGPWNYHFYTYKLGPSVSVSNGSTTSHKLDQVRTKEDFCCGFFVKEGDISEVYIGIDIELEVAAGVGGTFTTMGCLHFGPPLGEEMGRGVGYCMYPL